MRKLKSFLDFQNNDPQEINQTVENEPIENAENAENSDNIEELLSDDENPPSIKKFENKDSKKYLRSVGVCKVEDTFCDSCDTLTLNPGLESVHFCSCCGKQLPRKPHERFNWKSGMEGQEDITGQEADEDPSFIKKFEEK